MPKAGRRSLDYAIPVSDSYGNFFRVSSRDLEADAVLTLLASYHRSFQQSVVLWYLFFTSTRGQSFGSLTVTDSTATLNQESGIISFAARVARR